jgi:hypothetical protein
MTAELERKEGEGRALRCERDRATDRAAPDRAEEGAACGHRGDRCAGSRSHGQPDGGGCPKSTSPGGVCDAVANRADIDPIADFDADGTAGTDRDATCISR